MVFLLKNFMSPKPFWIWNHIWRLTLLGMRSLLAPSLPRSYAPWSMDFRGKDWPTKCLCPAVVFSMNVLAELPRGPMNKGPRSHQWNPHPKKVKNREESLRSLHESVHNEPGSQKVIQKRSKLTRTISSGGRISRVPYSPSAKKWRFWSAIKSWQRQPSILRRLGSGWGLWNTYFPTKTVSFFTEQHADIVWMNILCICTASPTVSLTLSYLWLW